MIDVDMQQLAALAAKVGTPIWHAAVRQVWVGALVELFWIAAIIVAMRLLLRGYAVSIKREQERLYGDADILKLMRGVVWVVGSLVVMGLASDVLMTVVNPTYAAVQRLTGLLP